MEQRKEELQTEREIEIQQRQQRQQQMDKFAAQPFSLLK
jgi:hypothetical protein